MTGQDDIVVKILSVDIKNYVDAPTEAIRRVFEKYYGRPVPRGTELDLSDVGTELSIYYFTYQCTRPLITFQNGFEWAQQLLRMLCSSEKENEQPSW